MPCFCVLAPAMLAGGVLCTAGGAAVTMGRYSMRRTAVKVNALPALCRQCPLAAVLIAGSSCRHVCAGLTTPCRACPALHPPPAAKRCVDAVGASDCQPQLSRRCGAALMASSFAAGHAIVSGGRLLYKATLQEQCVYAHGYCCCSLPFWQVWHIV